VFGSAPPKPPWPNPISPTGRRSLRNASHRPSPRPGRRCGAWPAPGARPPNSSSYSTTPTPRRG
jgi:hypothetical protein